MINLIVTTLKIFGVIYVLYYKYGQLRQKVVFNRILIENLSVWISLFEDKDFLIAFHKFYLTELKSIIKLDKS